MTLSALIHKRRRGDVATATPATFATPDEQEARTVATVATVAVAIPAEDVTARTWLLHFSDREPLEVWYSPAATHAQVLADCPDALAAEPIVAAARPCAIPMAADEEQFIRAWMGRIEESDPVTIADVLDKCQRDADARDYCIRRAAEELPNPALFCDDLRTCTQCSNLVGRRCQAAKRGEIVASRNYEPIRDMLKRCEGYAPDADDPDRRHGRERWPGLIPKGHE